MANRLAAETSPYLRQHADNPVDWYPWGEEALERARREDKPILLSIGYSACHWCHVMAHESFEDPEVAAEMNRLFVNVKVDREERPDIDQIYQTAHQMLTRRGGGWPLTMILMPDGTPFFAGTYFPKAARYGMPGFRDLLPQLESAYREQREEIAKQNGALMEALGRSIPKPAGGRELKRDPLNAAVHELARFFDDVHGGIGRAPKFPHTFELDYCLRRHALDGGHLSRLMTTLTLTRMAEGGIYDHLGGGFCRYSTDETWTIPHFEKMLYDNGPLLALYTDAWLVTRDPLYAKVAHETAAWVMREMQSPLHANEGGYHSSLDADSEGEEGRFYVWTPDEVAGILDAGEHAAAAPHFGLDGPPNFEGHAWHLRVARPVAEVAAMLGISLDACAARIESARVKLFAARERRVHPGRDDKVLGSWNALMVKAMARAGRVFGRDDWIASARSAVEFLRATLWKGGRLLATYKDGKAHLNAYLDDHAFLLDALLELLQTDFRAEDLHWATALADLLLAQFEDHEHGGFFFVSHDHEALIYRPKTGHDNATPSGNGVAAFALQRLGHLTGESRYLLASIRAVELFYEALDANPSVHTALLGALEEALTPPRLVVLRGAAAVTREWQARLSTRYRPDTFIVSVPEGAAGLPAPLGMAVPAGREAGAWICEGTRCLPPVFDFESVESSLASLRA